MICQWISIKDAVVPQFKNKEKQSITEESVFYDMFHPSNLGHTIMAVVLAIFLNDVKKQRD